MSNRLHEALRPVVDSTRSLLETAGPEAQAFLSDWPRELTARPIDARSLPVVGALRGLSRYAAPPTLALVEAIAALGELEWRRTYTLADFGARFLENYGFSEWIGQRGAFASDTIACGVLLLGPDTEYPAHSHEAEELYLPLAGRAWWGSSASDWRLRSPGTLIHHSPWMIHAMRTASEPLLAAYLWRAGDLTARSRIDEAFRSSSGEKGVGLRTGVKPAATARPQTSRFATLSALS
jgi:histidine ammonia-lyase